MRKKMIIIFSLTALFILTCSIISAKDHNAYQGEDVASGIGQALKEPIHEFIISEKEKPSQLSSSSNKSMIATVLGEGISKEYLYLRVKTYEACGSNNPFTDGWNSIKQEVWERQFAIQHNIMPTEEEISLSVKEMRESAEETEESHAVIKALITSAGFTENEYWEEYKTKYEMPLSLISANVYEYLEENNISPIDVNEIQFEILDQDYFDILNNSFNDILMA